MCFVIMTEVLLTDIIFKGRAVNVNSGRNVYSNLMLLLDLGENSGDEARGDLGVIGAGKAMVAAAVMEGELVVFQAH